MFPIFAFEPFNEQFQTGSFNALMYWAIALALLCISFKVIDWVLFPKMDFVDELRKGNVSLAIVLAAFILGFSAVIFAVIN